MRRIGSLVALSALVLALLAASGCQKKVEVQAGTRTVCTYGEAVSNDVRAVTVAADKAGSYRVVTKTVTCDRHSKIEALYEAAQDDIAKGDLTAAKAKLTQVIASDSKFRQAQAQLDTIVAGKKPTPDTGGNEPTTGSTPTTTTPKPGDEDPTGPVLSMLKWAPDTLTGFTAVGPTVDAMSFSRQYSPQSGSKVVSLVIAAEQFRSPDYAKAALDSQVKSAYPRDAKQVTVNGHKAYVGTDGRRFAILGFTQGAVLVQLEMSGKPGEQAALRDQLISVGKQLP